MGNSGSTHNINWDSTAGGAFPNARSKSELNGYFQRPRHSQAHITQDHETQTQTLLRRQHNPNIQKIERIKSLPLGPAAEQFKVLPKIAPENERLKLRPTTNGMLLHAGGTISGRNKDDLRAPGLMQRSRTLIFEQRENKEEFKDKVEGTQMPAFQRSQTLLHMTYKERDNSGAAENTKIYPPKQHNAENGQSLRHARSEPDFRNDLNKPTHARQLGGLDSTNVPTTTATAAANSKSAKLNKYNKKRKAPAAPLVNAADKAQIAAKSSYNKEEREEKSQLTRRFRSNINVKNAASPTLSKQQQQQQQNQNLTLSQQQSSQAAATASKPPQYRREKSSDAILLRSKPSVPVENAAEKRFSYGSRVINVNPTPATPSLLANPTDKNDEATIPKSNSKIPQLKRTFYFGDERSKTQNELAKEPNVNQTVERLKETKKDQTVLAQPAIVIAAEEAKEEEHQMDTLKYKLHREVDLCKNGATNDQNDEEDSEINDNGILVHIRPSLPRRQLEVPSFSPAAAWRMLASAEEEFRHRQIQRTSSNNLNCESPIQLRSNKIAAEVKELQEKSTPKLSKALLRNQLSTMAWTPQQDLEEDDDDDAKIAAENDTSSSDDFDGDKDEEDGLLFFNGHGKKMNGENLKLKANEKSPPQFFLSLPRDAHLDSQLQKKNSVNSNNNEKFTNFSSLQKLKLTISGGGGGKCNCRASLTKFSTSNGEFASENEYCEIHSNQAMYRSDNWVLHSTRTKDGANASKNVISNDTGKLLKEDITPTVEPISLSFLTAGKHVMYLPGITAPSKDAENESNMRKEMTPLREPTKASARQRQRKKETRESLQDETPVLRQHQTSTAQSAANNTQRFSFQSTVRLLEKRRLAEKLSRDAEIREAQRKSELEAMKRVEEDFQRKRASEKANIRHQLRLYCSGSGMEATHDQYNSLPAYASRQPQQQQLQHNDSNNNKITARRTEPEGAAASPSPSPLVVDIDSYRFGHEISHLPLKRMDSDCGDSDNDDITHFNRTASLVEPYLQSFMK